ncbi:MAG TPA: hypothetical protein VFP55_13045 [Solirubrobacteraceae bacterium]|nr:hypothetical protein [Solirubrobacteraceae bacterium]
MKWFGTVIGALALALAGAGCGAGYHGTAGASPGMVASASARATANVSQQLQAVLKELGKAADELASSSRMHRDAGRSELINLYHSAATVKSSAQRDLKPANRARAPLTEAADAAEGTATGLNRARWNPHTAVALLQLGGTLNNLSIVTGAVTSRSVSPATGKRLATDIHAVLRALRAAARGA